MEVRLTLDSRIVVYNWFADIPENSPEENYILFSGTPEEFHEWEKQQTEEVKSEFILTCEN